MVSLVSNSADCMLLMINAYFDFLLSGPAIDLNRFTPSTFSATVSRSSFNRILTSCVALCKSDVFDYCFLGDSFVAKVFSSLNHHLYLVTFIVLS